MALLTWNDKYSVGVPTIDAQHKVLFDIINSLHDAMMKGQAQALTGPLLHRLADYTNTHFTSEEGKMSAAKYPGLAEHKVKHRNLVKQVEEFVLRYDKGEIALNLQLLNFLRDWLTNHIQKEDLAYSPSMVKLGLH